MIDSLISEKKQMSAIRSLSTLSLHKMVQVAGLAMTVAFVPRLFGAEDYGRFALALSLAYLGQVLGDFGTLDVLNRFVPGMARVEAGRLYMRTLIFKTGVGLVCGVITAGLALALSDWMSPTWAGLIGLAVALHIIAWVPFQFALGLNRVGVWMAEQAWRQWTLLILLLVLLPLLGLTGAFLAVLVMDVLFCFLGLWWVRDYWQYQEFRFDWPYLTPYIRFGLSFFLANLAAVALYRSGPMLVEWLTGDVKQTGYFNLALGLLLLVYVTLGQFAQGLLPLLSGFYSRCQIGQMRQWLHNFIRYGGGLSCLGVAVAWLLADRVVPLVFGLDFGPAAASLKWISLGLPPATLVWAGNVLATAVGRGRIRLGASLAALLTFIAAAIGLIPLYAATGAAVALDLAVVIHGVILGVYLWPHFVERDKNDF
jgi:O-antigen/teichoic acid export membrane protein